LHADAFYDEKESYDHYAAAWALVHFLRNSTPEREQRFERLFGALGEGRTHEEAWQGAFGDLPKGALEEGWREHAASLLDQTPLWKAPWTPPAPPDVATRPMSDQEVHLLWIRVRPRIGKWRPRVEADLAEALAGPTSAEAQLWLGLLRGDESALRRATELAPTEERYQLALATRLYERAHARRDLAAVEPTFRALFKIAHAAETLNAIAWYYAERAQPEVGLPFARRAMERSPSCWGCLDTWALLAFENQAVDEAVALQQRALDLVPEGRKAPGEMIQRMARYRAAAAQKHAAPAAPPLPAP
jgi:hypothetical protein